MWHDLMSWAAGNRQEPAILLSSRDEAAWEDAILQGAQHPLPATQPRMGCVAAGTGMCCALQHKAGASKLPAPPATSCSPGAGLTVTFHPGCGLCPNKMFFYVPLKRQGPIQGSLLI